MKKCTKPEMEIVMLDDKDILTESSCSGHICEKVSSECGSFNCTSVTCNLQGCNDDNCEGFNW